LDDNNTPIDEYFFKKTLIEDKIADGKTVSKKHYQLLNQAEYRLLLYLIKKYSMEQDMVVNTSVH
jgi:hypothetical protein